MYPSYFSDLQAAVLAKGKLDDQYDTDRIKDWINQTYYQACVETEFYVNVATTSPVLNYAQSSVAIPTALIAVDYIVPTGTDGSVWGPMKMVPMVEILEQRAYNAGVTMTTGAPTRFCFRSGATPTIEFWPQASGGEKLTFFGTSFPSPLVNDADRPIIPEPYASKVLEYGSLVQAAEFKRDIFILDFFQQMYVDWMTRFRAFTNSRIGDDTQQFRVEGTKNYPRMNSSDTPYNWR